MCVNKVPFLHSMPEGIMLIMASHINSLSKTALKEVVNKTMKVCKNGGFNVKNTDADMQFQCMQEELEEVEVDIVDSEDHVEEVERAIRTEKEGIKGLVQGLPFRRMPRLMVRQLVEVAARNLNTFPAENGMSDALNLL